MKNIARNEKAMVRNRFADVFKTVGEDAWDELKGGVDKAWDELRISIDKSISTASQGLSRGWEEFSFGIGRAKDSLLRNPKKNDTNNGSRKNRNKGRERQEKEELN